MTPFERYQNGCNAAYGVIAHAIFRNDGGPSSAKVILSVPEVSSQQCEAFLTDATTKVDVIATGATGEGSCTVGATTVLAQYKVTVVSIEPF